MLLIIFECLRKSLLYNDSKENITQLNLKISEEI